MNKLIILVAIAIGAMAFAQKDKGGQSQKGDKGGNQGQPKQMHSKQVSKSPAKAKENRNVTFADQGQGKQKDKGGGGKHYNGPKQGKQGGHGGNRNVSHKKAPKNMKSFQKSQKHDGDKGGKHHNMNQPGKGYKDKGHYAKNGKHHYGKGHPNFGYLYINVHGDFGHGNYGQYRSKQAKKKHKHYHPVYEYEARDGFNFIIVRNTFLYEETDYKIDLVRVRLGERRNSGAITVIEYDRCMNRVEVLERRRASLEVNISL